MQCQNKPKTRKKHVYKELDINFVSLCKQGVNPHSHIIISKEKKMGDQQTEMSVTLDEKALAKAIADALGEVKDAEDIKKSLMSTITEQLKPIVDHITTIEKAKALEADEYVELGEEKIYKSKIGDSAFANIKKAHEELIAKSLEIEKRDYEAKAEAEYPHVSGTKEEKGAFLADIEKCLPEKSRAFAKSLMSALNEKTQVMTQPQGETADNVQSSADIMKARVDDYVKNHNVTEAEAYVKLVKEMGDAFFEGK